MTLNSWLEVDSELMRYLWHDSTSNYSDGYYMDSGLSLVEIADYDGYYVWL